MKQIAILLLCFYSVISISFGQTAEIKTIGHKIFPPTNHTTSISSQTRGVCDTTKVFNVPSVWPSGIAWDGDYFWASGYTIPQIYKIDPLGNIVDSIDSPSSSTDYHGGSLHYDGTNLLCTVEQDGNLYKLNTTTSAIIQVYDLPEYPNVNPNNLGVTFDGQNIWTVHHFPDWLYKIDIDDGQVLDSISLPINITTLEWINGQLYGLSFFNPIEYLYTIDTSNGSLIDSVEWCVPSTADITWNGTNLWCVTRDQEVFKMGDDFINPTAISAIEYTEDFAIFPNPTSGIITLDADNILEIKLINTKGQILPLIRNGNVADLSIHPTGIYFLQIFSSKGLVTKTVIKH